MPPAPPLYDPELDALMVEKNALEARLTEAPNLQADIMADIATKEQEIAIKRQVMVATKRQAQIAAKRQSKQNPKAFALRGPGSIALDRVAKKAGTLNRRRKEKDEKVRRWLLQQGLHFTPNLVNDSIIASDRVSPDATFRAMGDKRQDIPRMAKDHMLAALACLRDISDPVPMQLRLAVSTELDLQNTPDRVYGDTLTAVMASVNQLHICTSGATSAVHDYLELPPEDRKKDSAKKLDVIIYAIKGTYRLDTVLDYTMTLVGLGKAQIPCWAKVPTVFDAIRHQGWTPAWKHVYLHDIISGEWEGMQPNKSLSPRDVAVEALLRVVMDMARINFLARVLGRSLMVSFGQLDPEKPNENVKWHDTDLAIISNGYRSFEALQKHLASTFMVPLKGPVTYKFNPQCLQQPELKALVEPTINALKQQQWFDKLELGHVLDPSDDSFSKRYEPEWLDLD